MGKKEFKSVVWLAMEFNRNCINCKLSQQVNWNLGITLDENGDIFILPVKDQPYYYQPPCAILKCKENCQPNLETPFAPEQYVVSDIWDLVKKKMVKMTKERWKDVGIWWNCRTCGSKQSLFWAHGLALDSTEHILMTQYKQGFLLSPLVLLNGDCIDNFSLILFFKIPESLFNKKM